MRRLLMFNVSVSDFLLYLTCLIVDPLKPAVHLRDKISGLNIDADASVTLSL